MRACGVDRRNTRYAVWALIGVLAILAGRATAQEAIPTADPDGRVVPHATQPTVCRLTLDAARQRALSNNKAIVLARMSLDGKRYATAAATKDYFPKVLGNVTYFHFDNPLGTVLTTHGAVLPTTIQANVLNQNTTLSTAMVAQPITKLIAVHAAVQVSRADENIARALLDQDARQVLSGVAQAYYGLIGAQRIRAVLELQATVLEQAVAANPLPDTRIHLVEMRQGVLQLQGQIRELTDQLNDLLDFPPGTMLELVDPLPLVPSVGSAEQAAQMAMAANPEIQEAAQNIVKAEAALKVARLAYVPDVNVIGGYANQTGASYIQANINYVGVTGTYTFFEWGKKHDVSRQREADVALAHQNLHVVSDKVRLEAAKSFGALEQALAGYRLAGEMVQARQDAERAASDATTLMSARAATASAQLEYMKAEIGYRMAHAQLAAAIGSE
ncbi:MAG TPA: TolC family protein [Pirellulales bacterium]|jgi:outer membrane protein TolC|nr:TolC family protein [Pirellulales bacterium]